MFYPFGLEKKCKIDSWVELLLFFFNFRILFMWVYERISAVSVRVRVRDFRWENGAVGLYSCVTRVGKMITIGFLTAVCWAAKAT